MSVLSLRMQRRMELRGVSATFRNRPAIANQEEEERVATAEAQDHEYCQAMAADYWETRSIDSDGHVRDNSIGYPSPPTPDSPRLPWWRDATGRDFY